MVRTQKDAVLMFSTIPRSKTRVLVSGLGNTNLDVLSFFSFSVRDASCVVNSFEFW